MKFKKDEIIILLGAGASKDAGIPTSVDMIQRIEQLLEEKDWEQFRDLYNYIKSAIYYADGISGKFGSAVQFNIERLINTLNELEKKEEHTIYPFIGNWNIKLIELAEADFIKISEFKNKIIHELRDNWILIEDYSQASYYSKLLDFKDQYTFSLRIFSLNYDLCVEKNCSSRPIERGFEQRKWDWRSFDGQDEETAIYLYKLHGSIDWKRNEAGILTYSDEPGKIDTDDLEIIFGTSYKMQYIDPFLFFAYEFRRYCLESKLIITIGYGFGDEHINGIIGQALNNDKDRKILAVMYLGDNVGETEIKEKEIEIQGLLKLNFSNQVVLRNFSAKEFFRNHFDIKKLESLFPEAEGTPF